MAAAKKLKEKASLFSQRKKLALLAHIDNYGDAKKCWAWQGPEVIRIGTRSMRPLAFTFWLKSGEYPSWQQFKKKCSSKNCVNPDHHESARPSPAAMGKKAAEMYARYDSKGRYPTLRDIGDALGYSHEQIRTFLVETHGPDYKNKLRPDDES